jgi:hypothetical protein
VYLLVPAGSIVIESLHEPPVYRFQDQDIRLVRSNVCRDRFSMYQFLALFRGARSWDGPRFESRRATCSPDNRTNWSRSDNLASRDIPHGGRLARGQYESADTKTP